MTHILRLSINIYSKTLGTRECKLIIKSWFDHDPVIDAVAKVDTREYGMHSVDVSLYNVLVRITMHHIASSTTFSGRVISPDELIGETLVKINDTLNQTT